MPTSAYPSLSEIQVDLDVSGFTTADQWNGLGLNYHKGNNGLTRNYLKAITCFIKALLVDKNHAAANYNVAIMHQEGHGITKDIAVARFHYGVSADQGDEDAKLKSLKIEMDDNFFWIRADDWNSLGVQYDNGKGRPEDWVKARLCYEEALKLDANHRAANYNLGITLELGLGAPKNIPRAKSLYERSAAQGDEDAKLKLLKFEMQEHNWSTAVEWNNLGYMYYGGREGRSNDYVKARLCFDEALKLEPNHSCANYNLGLIYEHGRDVKKDLAKAKEYYEKAGAQGDEDAKLKSLKLEMQTLKWKTADDWCSLGHKYYQGENRPEDFIKSRLCYEQAFALEPSNKYANQQLGLLHHLGRGTERNFAKAKEFYKASANQDYELPKIMLKILEKDERHVLRELEKRRIEELAATGNINQKDSNGDTALHRTAKLKFWKHYARLLYLGANPLEVDRNGNRPEYYLRDQKKKVEELLHLFTQTIDQYHTHPPTAISSNIDCNASVNRQESERKLAEIYNDPNIKPILDVVKFARYGKHDRSGFTHFNDPNYVSDDEDEIGDLPKAYFHVVVDPDRSTVEGTFCEDGDGAFGVYHHLNRVNVGGAGPKTGVLGTLLHELTHFVTDEVFGNDCKPYRANDAAAKSEFENIANRLEARKHQLPTILRGAFSASYKKTNQVHEELIVRVIQTYYEQGKLGPKEMEKVPELWNYYINKFLPAVRNHADKLSKRMMSNWSPELFGRRLNRTYNFDETGNENGRNNPANNPGASRR